MLLLHTHAEVQKTEFFAPKNLGINLALLKFDLQIAHVICHANIQTIPRDAKKNGNQFPKQNPKCHKSENAKEHPNTLDLYPPNPPSLCLLNWRA